LPEEVKQINVFVSCPDDVKPEKQIVRNVCDSISKVIIRSRNIQVKVIDWSKDVVPMITGESAQNVIDEQIKEYNIDIYIGVLWKRFGDTQSSGLTPTEGEFEDSLRRRKETGKPIIQFYFKKDEFYPNSVYEAQQSLEVQQFKERIRPLGYYIDFKGEENFNSLTSKKPSIKKIKYSETPHYLPRKISSIKEYKPTYISILRSEISQDLISIIEHNNRIII